MHKIAGTKTKIGRGGEDIVVVAVVVAVSMSSWHAYKIFCASNEDVKQIGIYLGLVQIHLH